ncbi:MAG TPA: hypothetical protein PKA05_22380 [Roseiflexaceae bacterium]|nr:hypothetical protein [Roseiflexaceae bacterium]
MDATYHELIAPGLIDSPIKLKILLVYCRYPQLQVSAVRMRQWLSETPWELEESLQELTAAGLLRVTLQHEQAEYCFAPSPAMTHYVRALLLHFDDPEQRDAIYELVDIADTERRFLKATANRSMAVGGTHETDFPSF